MNPDEAARSLAAIRETQTKAIRSQPWFPTWYVVGVGAFVTGVQAVTEPAPLDVPYARTVAALAMTVSMAVTGPMVAWWISRRMARKIEERA
ncbi:hypothetical protein [Nonomuraea lactucae]|uniref:hypothetical protein n=1 Tax=Nonomuraea lactucae TaxID=2249762 RepID=UPI000DE3363B|nr:hypothetical protein [Nonomuraea lactucae]